MVERLVVNYGVRNDRGDDAATNCDGTELVTSIPITSMINEAALRNRRDTRWPIGCFELDGRAEGKSEAPETPSAPWTICASLKDVLTHCGQQKAAVSSFNILSKTPDAWRRFVISTLTRMAVVKPAGHNDPGE
jgi:hypothetical protein